MNTENPNQEIEKINQIYSNFEKELHILREEQRKAIDDFEKSLEKEKIDILEKELRNTK